MSLQKTIAAAALAITLLASHAQAGDLPQIRVYGFARLDMIFDDSRMQHPQFPMWVESEDPITGNRANDAELSIHPRLTRLGFAIEKFNVSRTVAVDGKIEIDFQAGGSESRELIRMRHGYSRISYFSASLLAGQTWDLISPLYPSVNSDGLMWNAGNLGDRRPQLRLTSNPKMGKGHLRASVMAGMPNAVDKQDLDKNGDLDGFDAAVPMFQALVEITGPFWTQRPFRLGGSAHYALLKMNAVDPDNPPSGAFPYQHDKEISSFSVNAHLLLPIVQPLWLQGEIFYGQDLSDVRGGIGQPINTATGDALPSMGGWGELGFQPVAWWSGHVGGSIDNPSSDDIADGQRSRNYTVYVASRFRPWKPFQIAIEYLHWVTEYKGLGDGTAHRVDVWSALHFDLVK